MKLMHQSDSDGELWFGETGFIAIESHSKRFSHAIRVDVRVCVISFRDYLHEVSIHSVEIDRDRLEHYNKETSSIPAQSDAYSQR